MKFKLFFLLLLLLSSSLLAMMNEGEKTSSGDVRNNNALAKIERDRDLTRICNDDSLLDGVQQDQRELLELNTSTKNDDDADQIGNTTQTQLVKLEHVNLHEEVLLQRCHEAEEAAAFWKTEHDNLALQVAALSDAEKNSLIEDAHRACDYWTQISQENTYFISSNNEPNQGVHENILNFISLADTAALWAQTTCDLLLKKDSNQFAREIFQNRSLTPDNLPENLNNSSSSSSQSAVLMEGGYLFPQEGGCFYNNLHYTQHALERMAPNTPEIVQLLTERAFKRMPSRVQEIKKSLVENKATLHYADWWEELCPYPRGILPSAVEAALKDPRNTDLVVKTDGIGNVIITVFRNLVSSADKSLNLANVAAINKKAKQIEKQFSLERMQYFDGDNHIEETIALEILALNNPEKTMDQYSQERYMQKKSARILDQALYTRLNPPLTNCIRTIKESKQASKNKSVDIAAWKKAQKEKKI